jgi:hypothetical protein
MNFRNWLYVSGPSLDRMNDLDGEGVDSYTDKFREFVSEKYKYIPAVYIRYQADGKTSYKFTQYQSYSNRKYGEREVVAGTFEQHLPLSTVLDCILLQLVFT